MRKNNKEIEDPELMIEQMFNRVDTNKDGKVTLEELREAFKKYRD